MQNKLVDAIFMGSLKEVKRLLIEGADVHAGNDRALLNACITGNLGIVKLLVAYGANIHAHGVHNLISYTRNYNKNGYLEVLEYLNKQLILEKINELS
jgi:hypothetical protein